MVSTHSRPKAAGGCQAQAYCEGYVSTHSRPKAAGRIFFACAQCLQFQHTAARRRLEPFTTLSKDWKCFNTQPPEGGWNSCFAFARFDIVSTHSRPKAAGSISKNILLLSSVSTHSRPKAAGAMFSLQATTKWFQHTAARRRLDCSNA